EELRAKAGELDFTTLWGRFKIDPETGLQTGHDMVVMMWIEGDRYIVWPTEAAERDPVYPKPPWGGT
nr:branched-chain amino acid ABC transporter substrate-binding protein [Anaerolineae bacterium]